MPNAKRQEEAKTGFFRVFLVMTYNSNSTIEKAWGGFAVPMSERTGNLESRL